MPSCSSSTTISPRLRTGANTPDRVPTTTDAAPDRMRRHCSERSTSVKALCRMATRSPKRREELARHGRRERDFRHQQQRAAAFRQRRLDAVEIDLGLARPGHAVQQKRLVAVGVDGFGDLLVSGLLRWIQRVPHAYGAGCDRHRLGLEGDQLLCARAIAPPGWRCARYLPALSGCASRGAVPGRRAVRARAY